MIAVRYEIDLFLINLNTTRELVYLENVSKDVNQETTDREIEASPRDHRTSPFRFRDFCYVYRRRGSCHARRYTGNRTPHKKHLVTFRQVNGHPTRH